MVQNSCDHQLRFGSLSHHLHGFKNIQNGGCLMLFGISEASTVRETFGWCSFKDFKEATWSTWPAGFITIPWNDTTVTTDPMCPRDTPSMSRCTLQQSLRDANPERLPNRKKKDETCATVEVIWRDWIIEIERLLFEISGTVLFVVWRCVVVFLRNGSMIEGKHLYILFPTPYHPCMILDLPSKPTSHVGKYTVRPMDGMGVYIVFQKFQEIDCEYMTIIHPGLLGKKC